MKKTILMIMAGVMILASCATGGGGRSSSGGKKPSWIDDKHSAYPEEKYLVEIGIGSSLREAKQDGAAALSQIFRTTVKVDSMVRTRYQDLSDGENILESAMETTADETITQLSDETLINVHYGESWTDSMGKTYTAAYIDRMETAMIYRQRIEQDSARTSYFIQQSKTETDLLRSFGYLDAGLVMDKNILMMLDQLDIIHSPSRRSVMLGYDRDTLYSLYSDTASRMVYTISVEGDDEQKITSSVAQVLTGRGFSLAGGGSGNNLTVTGRIVIEDAALDNGYENIRWSLYLEMRNEIGDVVVTMEERKRETGISREAAVERGFRSMEEMLRKKFLGDLDRYFDSFAGR